MTLIFRAAERGDLPAIVALNDAAIPHVNALPERVWHGFLAGDARVRVASDRQGAIAALTVVLPPGRAYGSENYAWFQRKLADFAYVDRIVVGEGLRGRGVGRAAYADVARVMAALSVRGFTRVNLITDTGGPAAGPAPEAAPQPNPDGVSRP
jgi:predicted GNAT superfamily acetyltransferase